MQLATQSAEPVLSMAGKPANVCPHCGCGMFTYKTLAGDTRTLRYERCRNCKRKFLTRQPHAEIVREIETEEDDE